MFHLLWPILLVVGANTVYNIAAKSTPPGINSFASLAVSYFVAMVSAIALFFATSGQKNLLAEFSKMNWTSVALGIVIVALEFGYISAYRAGWKVSIASLVANISLAVILLVVGLLLYKESLSLRQILGMCLCGAGLVLIAR